MSTPAESKRRTAMLTAVWDEGLVARIDANDRGELLTIRRWIEQNAARLRDYAKDIDTSHPALWWSYLMRNVEAAMDKGSEDAIAIGYRYVCDDPKAPFGRIHKRRVLKRLRRNVSNRHVCHLVEIRDLIDKFQGDGYKPQEYNDMVRLEAALAAAGS